MDGFIRAIHEYYITHRIHGAGIYANIGGILMGSMLPYIAYMDPMGYIINITIFVGLVFPLLTMWVEFFVPRGTSEDTEIMEGLLDCWMSMNFESV